MTTLAAPAPRAFNFKSFFLIIAMAMIAAFFGTVLAKGLFGARNEITVKPCATCASCSCKPLLGGPRCGCPK